MAKVELKQPVVKEISDKIQNAQALVLVDHRGLTVAEDTELRRKLRAENVSYKVYKNTMMNFAFKGTDFEQLSDLLNGPSALAISETDPAAPARVLVEFAKKAKALEVKGGVIESCMTQKHSRRSQQSFPRISCFPSCLVLCSHLSQTSLALLSRSLRRRKRVARQHPQQRQLPQRLLQQRQLRLLLKQQQRQQLSNF